MKRLSIAICILLLFALTSAATTPTTSNASLKGTYVFLVTKSVEYSWGQSLNCGGNQVFMGGSETRLQASLGTMTFDGLGGVSGSFNTYGRIDQTSSDNTASCTSNGNAVFFGPQSETLSGSYTVQANSTGSMTVTTSQQGGGSTTFNLELVGNCASTGVNDALLMSALRSDDSVELNGSARLQ